jgi:hypothetical protein
MRKGRLSRTLFLVIVSGLFVWGVTELLALRFQRGDVYPPYSSYRSDPLGTKAFYEGLGLLPAVETVRNVEPLPKVSGLSGAALFIFGLEAASFSAMDQGSVRRIEEAAREGGRIVISFVPVKDTFPEPSKKEKREGPREKDGNKEETEERDLRGGESFNLAGRWGVEMELFAGKSREAILVSPERDLPPAIDWHGHFVFKPREEAWRALYARAGRPVVIERSFGKGSIVLSSDSFFVSNEAMKRKRYPQLLSWLCGARQKIIFDETHLGVSRSPNLVTLLRRHGLAPFFISLIVLALLAIWRQSVELVPPWDEGKQIPVDPGKDSLAGITNLLVRNISSDRILSVCLEEWKRSFTHGKQNRSALLSRIEEIIAAEQGKGKRSRGPVQAYRKISLLNTEREK